MTMRNKAFTFILLSALLCEISIPLVKELWQETRSVVCLSRQETSMITLYGYWKNSGGSRLQVDHITQVDDIRGLGGSCCQRLCRSHSW